jgi:hypothetical protein
MEDFFNALGSGEGLTISHYAGGNIPCFIPIEIQQKQWLERGSGTALRSHYRTV